MLFFNAPASQEAEWNEWLDRVHMPARLALPGFLSARRFIAIEGDRKYFHFFGLTDASVLDSEPYLKLGIKERSDGDPSCKFMALSAAIPDRFLALYEQVYPRGKVFREPQAPFILAVGLDVPREKDEEFNDWYDTEHIPEHLKVPGFTSAYRFRSLGEELSLGRKATGPKYVTLYEVENEKAFQTAEYEKSTKSPWTSWLRQFYVRRFRSIFKSIY